MAHVLFIISGEEGRKTLMLWTEQAMESCDALCFYSQQQGHNQSCKTKTLLDEHYCFFFNSNQQHEKKSFLFSFCQKKQPRGGGGGAGVAEHTKGPHLPPRL